MIRFQGEVKPFKMASQLEKGFQEGEAFIPRVLLTQPQNPQKRWTKKKICLITCLSCILVVLLVIGGGAIYYFSMGTFEGNTKFWEDLLNSSPMDPSEINISGTYNLVSFDEHYEEYLKSMGIPFFVVPLILSATEKIEISVSEEADPVTVTMKTITDWMTRTSEFQFDKEFSMKYGKGNMEGVMYNRCSRPKHNMISCKSEEREKKWNFESEIVFSWNGMINTRSFITKNIVTKKYYQKEGTEGIQPFRGKRSTMSAALDSVNEDWVQQTDDWFNDDWSEEEEEETELPDPPAETPVQQDEDNWSNDDDDDWLEEEDDPSYDGAWWQDRQEEDENDDEV